MTWSIQTWTSETIDNDKSYLEIWVEVWLFLSWNTPKWVKAILKDIWYKWAKVYLFKDYIYVVQIDSDSYIDQMQKINKAMEEIAGNTVITNFYWKKQLFINIPWSFEKEVVMLVKSYYDINYIVIIQYDIYQDEKEYIINLFNKN